MKLLHRIAGLVAVAISGLAVHEDSPTTAMPALTTDTVCPGQTGTLKIAISGPMICMALYVIVLMQADSLREQVGGRWAQEIEAFLGPIMH
jgi:hypothetical protein